MAVVVDGSALAAIAFGEPESATLVAHLEGETLIAPTLIDYELANIAWKKARAHPRARVSIHAALEAALHLSIARVQVPATEMFRLAQETGLTAYDASYLWLARTHDAELVTLDRQLAGVAGVER
jgi:predicted nucleic acid-binding protein